MGVANVCPRLFCPSTHTPRPSRVYISSFVFSGLSSSSHSCVMAGAGCSTFAANSRLLELLVCHGHHRAELVGSQSCLGQHKQTSRKHGDHTTLTTSQNRLQGDRTTGSVASAKRVVGWRLSMASFFGQSTCCSLGDPVSAAVSAVVVKSAAVVAPIARKWPHEHLVDTARALWKGQSGPQLSFATAKC